MIVVKNIEKRFQSKKILNQISFHIKQGEYVGLIGLNGAGKTTLLHILAGILKEDSGFIRVAGCKNNIYDTKRLKNIGYVSGLHSQLWTDMKLIDSFENCGKMYGIKREEWNKRMECLLKEMDLRDCLELPVNQLSLGQRMRGEFVYAMIPCPKLLIMDEATIGLDVAVKERIITYLQRLRKDGRTTLLFVSHNLAEVERICDRLMVLEGGKLIYDGDLNAFLEENALCYRLSVEFLGEFPDFEDLPLERYEIRKNKLEIIFDAKKISVAVLIKQLTQKIKIINVELEEPRLEDIIRRSGKRGGLSCQ